MSPEYNILFEALSDEVRREILHYLKDKELCAQEIHSKFIASRTAISYHLSLLNKAGLLNTRKEGRNIYYSLNLDPVYRYLGNFIEKLIFSPSLS
ncbi:MAG: metalloregulator ArsR/SmtB family transcription factor [Candidatus Saganbacteria bacterium]|nr:metalloregulator ArsR/SmtB family transcription factor [Candidatus Saganbacteria bacterium]